MDIVKKIIFSVSAALLAIPAAIAQNSLTVLQKDGSSYSFKFEENPIITYTETDLVLTTDLTEVQYPIAGIEKLTFSDGEVSEVEKTKEPASEETFTVYDLEGKSLKTFKYSGNGDLNSATEGLPSGIYIIKSKSVTFKTIRK